MKLSSLKHGRNGKLVVVKRDLSLAVTAKSVAPSMQAALDDWETCEPKLKKLSEDLENGKAEGAFHFNPRECMSPLPRAYQWLDGSTYIHHIELVRKSRGAEVPEDVTTNPLMYQGGSDSFLAPHENIRFSTEKFGIDFEGEVAIITGDVPMGTSAAKADRYIRLVVLVNDVSLRYIAQEELKKGFGFVQAKPSSALSPIAVTPDELGDAWQDTQVHLPLHVTWNGKKFGEPNAGEGGLFSFAQLIAHASRTRPLCAGTIIGSGTVSNKDPSRGHACIAEKRMIEKMETGESKTDFMKFGDTIKIEMLDAEGKTIFGAIDQEVSEYSAS